MSVNLDPEGIAVSFVGALMKNLPDDKARVEALSALVVLGFNFLRQLESDEFVRGMLDGARADLNKAPDFAYRKPQ